MAAAMTFGMGTPAAAAANEISAMLQKGLFEEEANRNLDAAIKAYQSVIAQTEKDRQFAATAVFRLGECYRKQGNTNEANVQYRRILREFPDQTELAKLSAQQAGPLANSPTGVGDGKALAEELRKMSADKRRVFVQQKFPNPVMNSLMEKMNTAETELAGLKIQYGPQHPELLGKESVLKSLYQQIDLQVEAALSSLAIDKESKTASTMMATESPGESQEARDAAKEADEIKRIQVMVKDNPDLINAYSGAETPLLRAVNRGQLSVARYLLENGADTELKDQMSGQYSNPLISAARHERKEMVELLLKYGANPNSGDVYGKTALHWASELGFKIIAETLLAHKLNVNARDGNGRNPLRLAAEKGFKSLAELLVAHGAEINSRDNEGYTPLHAAASMGNKAIVEWLLASKADINAAGNDGVTPLISAVRSSRLEIAKTLLARGADIEAQRKNDRWRALHFAVALNMPEYCKLLLENHANLNATCRDSENRVPGTSTIQNTEMTPLMLAANHKFDEMAAVLLDFMPDLNLKGSSGRTALMIAEQQRDEPIVKQLLAHKANPNIADVSSETPLFLAVELNEAGIAEALIAHGADVNAKRPLGGADAFAYPGMTALQMAVGKNDTNLVKVLLSHEADPNTTVDSIFLNGGTGPAAGFTPLLTAVLSKNQATVQLLLEHKAEPSHPDKTGQTSLHLAVRQGLKEIAELLIAAGADVNARDSDGFSPLHLAAQFRNPEFIEILLAHEANINLKDNDSRTPLDLAEQSHAAGKAASEARVISILRQHGGVSEIELSTIRVTRKGDPNIRIIARRNPMSADPCTLYETIAFIYAPPKWKPPGTSIYTLENNEPPGFRFPDFDGVRIHRLETDGHTNSIHIHNLGAALSSGDCTPNAELRWGDLVEIPEADHKVEEKWPGLSKEVRTTLIKCLQRNVDILVKGQVTKVTLLPRLPFFQPSGNRSSPTFAEFGAFEFIPPAKGTAQSLSESYKVNEVVRGALAEIQLYSFRLNDVVRGANVILSSSDLTRVIVKRPNAVTKKAEEMSFDLEKLNHDSDLWLHDGDIIELPEKGRD